MSVSLKFLTYNIHSFIDRERHYNPELIFQLLAGQQADVIALQEVRSDDRHGIALLHEFAAEQGYELILGPTMIKKAGHHYGNALLFRGTLLFSELHDISMKRREPRGAIDVVVSMQKETWRIIATHLGLSPKERRRQIRKLMQVIDQGKQPANIVLLGDFNEWYTWGRPLLQLKRHFRLTHTPATFPSRFPLLSLDRIWINTYPATAPTIYTIKSPLTTHASDHLPLVALVDKSREPLNNSMAPLACLCARQVLAEAP